jgi:serine/threonine-protein kinase HipA
VVEVRAWGRRVGAVALDPRLGYYAFEYEPAWIATGIELAPRHMPLAAARAPFAFTSLPEATFRRLPALLADALPDEFGNALIDAWLATQGIGKAEITPLDRLAYMGARGVGALEFRPERGPRHKRPTALDMAELVEGARRALRGELVDDAHAAAALQQIIAVGTSAGGARAKAAIAWNPATGEIRSGQFGVEPGFEHWLLKFDGLGRDRELGSGAEYGRIEYAYHGMARRAGIAMTPCRLLEEDGRAHFMTRRFDRDGERKHHVQSLCAMDHLDYKQRGTHAYAQLFRLIVDLGLGYETLEEAYRRMAFNVMARNCDDHTKNVTFMLREGVGWALAPAYDLTFAHNPAGAWTHRHQMSVNGKFDGIARADLLAEAERFGVGTAPAVLGQVAEAVAAWPACAREAGLSAEATQRIAAQHLPQRPQD